MAHPSYFVVMVDHGKRGREAIVDPEVTRRKIIARIVSGEYGHINFIHHVDDGLVEDVTDELVDAAEAISLETEGSPAWCEANGQFGVGA